MAPDDQSPPGLAVAANDNDDPDGSDPEPVRKVGTFVTDVARRIGGQFVREPANDNAPEGGGRDGP